MRVFISSVRRGLGAERDYLPGLIRALGHEPSRFEDFGARNATSRDACLDGVAQADVYVLLLGPHYGDEMQDTGISATEEEYNVAQQRGIPILVFKKTGVASDPAQEDFIRRLGDYQQGRFWTEFSDGMDLGVRVAEALRGLAVPPPPLTYLPLTQPVSVVWRRDRAPLSDRNLYAPVLEVHALPTATNALRPVSQLADLAERLAIRGREIGFFGQGDALMINHDGNTAWALRPSDPRAGGRYDERQLDPFAGLAVGRDGAAMVFQALPTDVMGALVDQADLGQRIGVLLRILAPQLPTTEHIALAAALDPISRIAEGDPSQVGNRNSGIMAHGNSDKAARADPVDQVARASLTEGLPAVAEELAVRLLQALRAANTSRGPWG
ncbi:DUF4062 domain-containing protein [Blastococcus litoris]|uniref:DUF4062 domain-containing protein n=1 Tax=Blastococcus litoris TaxID=2171622 RepID=UPI000E300D7A|nr:DUF4062 domain-containing protein [Blastococcus litoris]